MGAIVDRWTDFIAFAFPCSSDLLHEYGLRAFTGLPVIYLGAKNMSAHISKPFKEIRYKPIKSQVVLVLMI
jgi:hypothetical protein